MSHPKIDDTASNPTARVLAEAEATARVLHYGQTDKAGQPYIGHVARVAGGVEHPLDKAVAWLHDVIEDTDMTREQLHVLPAGLSVQEQMMWQNVVADVALLTHIPGMSREDYLARVRMSPRAVRVKLSDNADNAAPSRLAVLDDQTRERLTAKYARDRELLGRGR